MDGNRHSSGACSAMPLCPCCPLFSPLNEPIQWNLLFPTVCLFQACYSTNMYSAGGKNPICSMTCCVFGRQFQIYLWSHGLTLKFSHKDLLSLPWCFIWYKLQPKNSSCLHASFILHVDAGWLIFFLFHFFLSKWLLLGQQELGHCWQHWVFLAAVVLAGVKPQGLVVRPQEGVRRTKDLLHLNELREDGCGTSFLWLRSTQAQSRYT